MLKSKQNTRQAQFLIRSTAGNIIKFTPAVSQSL